MGGWVSCRMTGLFDFITQLMRPPLLSPARHWPTPVTHWGSGLSPGLHDSTSLVTISRVASWFIVFEFRLLRLNLFFFNSAELINRIISQLDEHLISGSACTCSHSNCCGSPTRDKPSTPPLFGGDTKFEEKQSSSSRPPQFCFLQLRRWRRRRWTLDGR